MTNQKRIADNAARHQGDNHVGAAREGRALLQGILLCGHCGARLTVRYSGTGGKRTSYCCQKLKFEALSAAPCLYVLAKYLEGPIVDIVMRMLTRERLIDATRVVDTIEEQDQSLDKQWQLRLERARYEAKRAERQYDACDPDNRVVGRTLEKRWNDKLATVEELEQEYDAFKANKRASLSDLDRQRIVQLATDLPRLWQAASTTDRDRKLLLRSLIKDVTVRKMDVPRSALRLQLLWHSGAVTVLEVDLSRPRKRGPVPYELLETRAPVTNGTLRAL